MCQRGAVGDSKSELSTYMNFDPVENRILKPPLFIFQVDQADKDLDRKKNCTHDSRTVFLLPDRFL